MSETITLYACPKPGCPETFEEENDYWVHYREAHIE